MYEHMADYALKNVWCTPGQDKQAVFEPKRLTPDVGVWNRIEIMRKLYNLPTNGERYHVFWIGQLNPLIIGLTPVDKKWVNFATACEDEALIVDFYTAKGLHYPTSQSWYYVTEDKNVIIAVKDQPKIPANIGVEKLFFRVYKNAFYNSDRAHGQDDFIEVVGATVVTTTNILDLQNKFNAAKERSGLVYAFVNGYITPTLDLFSVEPGDCVEYVYDGSIYRTVDFKIGNLPAFTSILDLKQKFLLHTGIPSDTIDYQDDIDFYVYNPAPNNRFKGVFYHRNKEDSIRMVTHCDYALVIPYLEAIAAAQTDWAPVEELHVRMHVRKAGWKRPLVFEANRIKELYKMDDADIIKAMSGVDSTVSPWRAEVMEASAYCQVMKSKVTDLDPVLVRDCFGYNALSKHLGDSPLVPQTSSGQQIIDVPFGIQLGATAYEYDQNGHLIDFYQHLQGSVYACRNAATKLVELVGGSGGERLDEVYGLQTSALTDGVDYRFYLCKMASGLPDNEWVDVTGSDKYSITNGVVLWNIDMTRHYPMVRGNRKFLAYNISLPADRGVLRFSLSHEQVRSGLVQEWIMQIPMGELDISLNNRPLIEGLDYFVNFPEIVIVNKKYMVNPMVNDQVIGIRFTGFCKSDLSREVLVDKGFIKHGLLSDNNRFDVRDDKVQRIIVDGKLYSRDELMFAESDSGVSVPDESNGAPYLIRDMVVQMRQMVPGDTYSLRAKAMVIDKAVSDYLSTKIAAPAFDTPNAIFDLYPVYSPFFAKILFDLKRGSIDNARIQKHYNDVDVTELCKPYVDLLQYDPTQEGQEPDYDYVIIHPHHLNEAVDVDLYQYRFLLRVIKLYLKDKVIINHLVTLST